MATKQSSNAQIPLDCFALLAMRGTSPKLAILAAPSIDGRVANRLVARRLAGNAGADARKRLAPLLRDGLAAIVAFLGAFARRRQSTGAQDRILHRVVDLVLNRAIARPSTGHLLSFLPGI